MSIFTSTNILLPQVASMEKWAVIACDQFSAEPQYWKDADALVADAPSTLRLIWPEAELDQDPDVRIPAINQAMADYLAKGIFQAHENSFVLVERTLLNGQCRLGVVGAVDLSEYDYTPGSSSAVRATEKTVVERIPPRVNIRKNAPLELPHVLLLCDDPEKALIETLYARRDTLPVLYDFDLMAGGGHIRGWLVAGNDAEAFQAAIDRYESTRPTSIRYAVGDGNHSLAAAKTCFEEVRAAIGDEAAMSHPARYALCEVVNLYDESLQFEPIYRVAFGVEPDHLLSAFAAYIAGLHGDAAPQELIWASNGRVGAMTVPTPVAALTVGTVQDFLDEYLKTAPAGAYVDYIHGRNPAVALANRSDAIAFLFDGMAKEELFSTVIADGALPRKTFSMGHAEDKRFYTEARRIRS